MSFLTRSTKQELITELQHLQTQLEASNDSRGAGAFEEDELRSVAPDIEGDELFLVTDTGKIVYASAPMVETLGYPADELIGKSLPDIDQDITRAAWLHKVSALKKSRTPLTFESRHLAVDGSAITKEVAASHITHKGRSYILCVARVLSVEAEAETVIAGGSNRESAILTAVSEGVVVVDTKGIIIDTNAAADRLLGLPKSEIIGRSVVDPRWRLVDMRGNQVRFSDHPVTVALVEEVPVVNKRIAMTQADGSLRILMVNASPMFDTEKQLVGAVASMRIHTVSEDNHEHVRRTSRLLTLHRDISLAAIRADSAYELERRICDALASTGEYALVWVGTVKENDFKVHPSTWAGESADYLLKVRLRYDDSEYGRGPEGAAITTGTVQVVADTQEDIRYAPWKKQAERSSLYSTAAFPVKVNGRTVAILSLYARDRNHFLDGEITLVGEIAEIFSFGVARLRDRDERAELERSSRRATAILSAVSDDTATGWCLFDAREPFAAISANRAFLGMLDDPFRSTGVERFFLSDFQHAHPHRTLFDALQSVLDGDASGTADRSDFTLPDGSSRTLAWRVIPITTAGGVEELLYTARWEDMPEGASAQRTSAVHTAASAPAAAATAGGGRAPRRAVEGELPVETWSPPPVTTPVETSVAAAPTPVRGMADATRTPERGSRGAGRSNAERTPEARERTVQKPGGGRGATASDTPMEVLDFIPGGGVVPAQRDERAPAVEPERRADRRRPSGRDTRRDRPERDSRSERNAATAPVAPAKPGAEDADEDFLMMDMFDEAPAASPVREDAPVYGPAHDAEGLPPSATMVVRVPTPAPRARKEKRIEQLFAGEIVSLDLGTASLLAAPALRAGGTVGAAIDTESAIGAALSEALVNRTHAATATTALADIRARIEARELDGMTELDITFTRLDI